jgi:hypothetical protein
MQIRRKNVDGKNLIVQYLFGSTNPYLSFCTIETESNEDAVTLLSLPDADLLERVKTALGAKMLADLQTNYA